MTFKKGYTPWNKGLTKETNERVKKSVEKRKLNLDEKEIIKLYQEKKFNCSQIAKKFNCSRAHILNILKRNNIKRYPLGFFIRGKTTWNKGLKGIKTSDKGYIPWNKGLTKEDSRIAKLSEKTTKTILKRGSLRGEKNPMFGENHSEKTKVKMSNKKNKYYEEHPEAIEEIKKRRAKQILPVKDTKIEVKIQNYLRELGIEFFTHQYMKIPHGYQCDILIPYLNLVIECDGDYWHKYPIGRDIDNIRTKELIEKGFKVLRLWEFEIKEMSISEFKGKLEKFK